MKSYICVKLSNINYPIFANKKRDGKGVSGILSSCLIVFIHLRKTTITSLKGSVLYMLVITVIVCIRLLINITRYGKSKNMG